MITPLPGIGRGDIRSGTRSLWRYAASFPIPVADPVSMGEGSTPLVERPWRGGAVHFKLEWFAPTGSFKDRGASVMVSMLRQQGVTRLLEDSSGNGGAAIAAYAAAGGITAKILVPATTRPAKIVQMRAYGAEVELIPGTRQDAARRGGAPGRADFLRQPQLAGLLSPGNEDAGLRAVGGSGVPRSRQRSHPHRRRQQHPWMRHRLRRTPAIGRDRAASPALRGPARELRSPLRELRLGRRRLHARGDPSHDRRRNRHRKAGADARSPGCHPTLWRRGRSGIRAGDHRGDGRSCEVRALRRADLRQRRRGPKRPHAGRRNPP